MQTITITGYLSKDAESRQTQGGQSITNLNVPVKQGWGDKEQTNWYRVAIWGKRAEFAANFRKGDFITVTGELTIGEYNGKPQYEINANDFHSVKGGQSPSQTGERKREYADSGDWGGTQGGGFDDGLDADSIPF